MDNSFTLLITGKPFTGKSTISRLVTEEILKRNFKVEIVDGGILKKEILTGLSYSISDIELNTETVAAICTVLNDNGVSAVATSLIPFRKNRENLVKIHLTAPDDVLKTRDSEGFYSKHDLENFDFPAGKVDLTIDSSIKSPDVIFREIIGLLQELTFLEIAQDDYSDEEKAEIDARLKSLGYM